MKSYAALAVLLLFACKSIQSQTLTQLESSRIHLPNGWSLTPVGTSLPLGDLPLNIAVSHSKKYIAVTNNGQSTQSVQLISAVTKKVLHEIVIPKSWYGLKFGAGDKYLYASGGNDNMIRKYAVQNEKLRLTDSVILGKPWPVKISPTGIELDESKNLMFVTTKDDSSLYVIQLSTKKILQKIKLDAEAYTCLLSTDKKDLYISCWGGKKIIIYNIAKKALAGDITTGDHPNDMCISKNGRFLFVANANDNSISIIDIRSRKVVETLNAALYADAPDGSTTNAVALSPDDKTLYVANADNNCLAVFDVSRPGSSKSKGYIPVGWYPTALKVIGKQIYVANAKGFTSKPNPNAPDPIHQEGQTYHQGDTSQKMESQYIGGLFKGTLSIINIPTDNQLSDYSRAVYGNTPYNKDNEMVSTGEEGNPIPQKVGDPSPIKYDF
jgi:DNA-binding beta-propeller fold protein YncE